MAFYKHLFTPFKIGKVEIKNRITMAPMGEGTPGNLTGGFTERDQEYFVRRAIGGVGAIFTGVVLTDITTDPYTKEVNGVSYVADGTFNINHDPAMFKRMASRMVERVHSLECKMFLQLSMGYGRNFGHKSASELPVYSDPSRTVGALTKQEIQDKLDYLAAAAKIAKDIGFDGVEVHALHFGYLMDTFSIEFYNHRTDEYGGSFENRHRLVKQAREVIADACGWDYPVTMCLGVKSYMKDFNKPSLRGDDEVGRSLEEGLKIAQYLEEVGYDAIRVDVGTYDGIYWRMPGMYQPMGQNIEKAAMVKKLVSIPVMVAGKMGDPEMCEKAIAEGKIDAVALGRPLMADPDFAIKAYRGKPETIRPCLACYMCIDRVQHGKEVTCAVNPECRHEAFFKLTPALVKKKVMVIGGGVAGLEAARVAKLRGHDVTLYEKTDAVGGNLLMAGRQSFKTIDFNLIHSYEAQLRELGVDIRYKSEVDMARIHDEKPDVVVNACGSVPVTPKLSGEENGIPCMSCADALKGTKEIGQRVVIVGGGVVGTELALNLALQGKKLTIVEALPDILQAGKALAKVNEVMLRELLEDKNVDIYTSSKVMDVDADGAILKNEAGEKHIDADTLIWAVGFRPVNGLVEQLREEHFEVYNIGDSHEVANILSAIWSGYEVGRSI